MAGTAMTIGEGMALISAKEYEALVRDSERLAIVTNYLTNEKYSTLGTVETLLGVKKEGEE